MSDTWAEHLRLAATNGRIEWKQHALERMLERGISQAQVIYALKCGEIIESYPREYPLPACLLLYIDDAPLHVVAAYSEAADLCHVITAYRPSHDKFRSDWKTRK